MSSADSIKEAFENALEWPKRRPSVFAWIGEHDPASHPCLESFTVTGVGKVRVPVSPQDLWRLKCVAQYLSQPRSRQVWQVEHCSIPRWEGSLERNLSGVVTQACEHLLGVTVHHLGIQVQPCFEKLLLVSTNGYYHGSSRRPEERGAFGSLVVQVPVEESHEGGRLRISRPNDPSDGRESLTGAMGRCFTAAFYADCNFDIGPVTGGHMAFLVFSLVWPYAERTGLSPLELPVFASTLCLLQQGFESWSVCHRADWRPPSSAEDLDYSDDDGEMCIVDEDPPATDTRQDPDQCICVRLTGDYAPAEVEFANLEGRDHFVARLLQFVPSVDVRLAIVVDGRIVRWIDSDASLPRCKRLSLPPDRCVGGLPDNAAVLVVQPKEQSIASSCREGFDRVLDHLERRLSSAPDSGERLQLASTFSSVIAFCRSEPPQSLERTHRLLSICLGVGTEREGVALLQLLGREGLRDEHLARAVADVQWRVCGWKVSGDSILALMAPTRLVRQWTHFAALVIHLLDRNCPDGARQVADRLCAHLQQVADLNLSQAQIDGLVDMVMSLERDARTASRKRLAFLITLFRRLKPHRQCQVILDLRDLVRLRNTLSCFQAYACLCIRLPDSDFRVSPGPVADVIVPVLLWYLKLDNAILMEELVRAICSGGGRDDDLVDCILASPELAQLEQTEVGKNALATILLAAVDKMETNNSSEELTDHLVTFLARVVQLMPVDSRVMVAICRLVCRLDAERHCNVVVDLFGQIDVKKYAHCFIDFCWTLQRRSPGSLMAAPSTVVQVLRCFVKLRAAELVRMIFQLVCLTGWSLEDKSVLLEALAPVPNVWHCLVPAATRCSSETIVTLLEIWALKANASDAPIIARSYIRNEVVHPQTRLNVTLPFSQLTGNQLCGLIVQIQRSESDRDLLKKSSLFRHLCGLVGQTNLDDFDGDSVELMKILLWMHCDVEPLSHKLCLAGKASLLLSCPDVENLVRNSPRGRKAYCVLLDHRIAELRRVKSLCSRLRATLTDENRPTLATLCRLHVELERLRKLKIRFQELNSVRPAQVDETSKPVCQQGAADKQVEMRYS